jgi:hypothetical protein
MLQSKAQTYNDGLVKVYAVSNAAASGNMPVEKLTLKRTLRYEERTVGITRHYAAMQNNAKVAHLLRCPKLRDVSTQDVAIPNDGGQYKITFIQYPKDAPESMDLTLEAVKQKYDIA